MQSVDTGLYRHFKGSIYEVLCAATHTETGETVIVYRDVNSPEKVWVRPEAMWFDHIERDGYSGPRFTYIGQE